MGGYAARQRRRSRRANDTLKSIHGLDAEEELTDILVDEIHKAVDQEILDRIATRSLAENMNLPYSPDSFTIDQLIDAIKEIMEKKS
jgi:hypothetical protein